MLSSDIQSGKICDILIETDLKPRGHFWPVAVEFLTPHTLL